MPNNIRSGPYVPCFASQVRGPNYLSDKKKVEAEALEAELLSVDLVDVAPTFHIARHLPSALHCTAPFMFIMQVPPLQCST
jgi:Protein ENHANCED DISEASE RESISTANCE 2, C-terminal